MVSLLQKYEREVGAGKSAKFPKEFSGRICPRASPCKCGFAAFAYALLRKA
jgi:hypothetical protein